MVEMISKNKKVQRKLVPVTLLAGEQSGLLAERSCSANEIFDVLFFPVLWLFAYFMSHPMFEKFRLIGKNIHLS